MSKKFEQRIINEVIVDTAKYRYCMRGNKIVRIERSALDTMAVYDGWEVVKVY